MTRPTPVSTAVRVESEAVYSALILGTLGGLAGLLASWGRLLPLWGPGSLASIAALSGGLAALAAGTLGYWRSRGTAEQHWRQNLPRWKAVVNILSVVLAHVSLAVLALFAVFLLLSRAFIGATMDAFWSVTLVACAAGLSAYFVWLSASRISTQRMSSLLVSFIALGTLTAMTTTPDPGWWRIHFSHLGTFWSLSSLLFNGTLIIGGLLVMAFAIYLDNDLGTLVGRGIVTAPRAPRTVSTMLVIMGVMLAGVGLVPVNLIEPVHNLSAMGMAAMFIGLLAASPWILRGMPRTYFLSAWAFLAITILSVILFIEGYFGLTAFEVVVFTLIFSWIAVFIRFLVALVNRPTEAPAA
ncbi:hypothetical protein [Mycetocola spongiae]|uniref:hypothetical protein n=1 Tax=Mycetocola spongiae TaxID=2859226 RepID=UPI001CF17F33|nr:hypothetical protein [Mycetocola spongiae]UCR89910.1 hypothetical protein KXZ72_04370 [Mycetocola spongiae]